VNRWFPLAGNPPQGNIVCTFSAGRPLHDLFAQKVILDLPRQIDWSASRLANPIYLLRRPAQQLSASILDFEHKGIRGFKAITQDGHICGGDHVHAGLR
jgi:hypothetical protein